MTRTPAVAAGAGEGTHPVPGAAGLALPHPDWLYHHLRLHPYGRTEEEKESMRLNGGQVISWA